jgi:hypothetical protein
MRLTLFAIAALLTGSVVAGNTIAFGNKVVSVGDSIGKVIEAAGQPDSRVQLETAQGGAAGERLEYYERGKTVLIWVQGGRVVRIEEVFD